MDKFLESLYVNKELHTVMFESICHKYHITLTELLILIFLNNYQLDTAKDIVKKLKIAKSHISSSIRDLEEKGYIECKYIGHDRRTIHLTVNESANEIISEGNTVLNQFTNVLIQGFSIEELLNLKDYIDRITKNANMYLKENTKK